MNGLSRIISLLDVQARRQFALLAVMTLIGALFEAMGVGLVFPFIKIITDPNWIYGFSWMATLTEWLGPLEHRDVMLAAGLGLIVLFVVKNAYLMCFYLVQYTISFGNVARYSTRLLAHYMASPYSMHLERNSAEMIRNVRVLPQDLFNALIAVLSLSTETLVVCIIGGALLVIEPLATLTAAALLIGMTGIFYAVAGRLLHGWSAERMRSSMAVELAAQEALNGVKDSRVLGREAFFVNRFARQSEQVVRLQRSIQAVSQVPRLSVEVSMMIGMIVLILIMAWREGGSVDLLPKLGVFAAAAFRLMPSVNRMTLALTEFKVSSAPLEALIHDMLDSPTQVVSGYPAARPELRSALELKKVSFRYPDAAEAAVTDVDLRIEKGDTIGLVGPSGAGKSTLVDIILGLLIPSDGKILLDGREIKTGGGWHGAVGYVPQSIFITDDTVRRNVAFGMADDEIDEQAVRRALAQARLDEFIEELPEGLDTRLAEDGIRLSGGQRQRIGIARALYHDPDLLVLDEATSALDPITEREISAAVEALHRSKTVIIIAHRLSTVRHCDRLLMINRGRIADSGTFDELHARNADFQKLVAALALTTSTP
ncbi:putative ABC transporter ATP-binding protein/permease [Magnetospirillum sp. XM-1]|uniref:ABC transporter ATP-binding protein n=1 Tax=Magnetospirillum sp. XM-1 TaxID=1663591 RepID=UPI00073DCF7A|nr:ABC transporter ATP-binding protein [Magnetospirillum sp. XM-1]CUW37990.1 putative ABC transporter ATP-binding protein/permease [Magnetospirillum sp. XM-1]